ncbi:MAG: DUF2330 domain-containing protein [Ferruginibacter sp.]
MKQKLLFIAGLIFVSPVIYSFCGFYVSKADGTLKNKTSQVILVRDGNRNVITMYNDFKGDIKDFAMVVPVPVVLNKEDIKVVNQNIFQLLNDYSAPRLVEYYDENPCEPRYDVLMEASVSKSVTEDLAPSPNSVRKKDLGVKVEAQYLVGEYDIMILSAKESGGLKTWLTENGYKIPAGAEEVLDPYIKSNLKFFVVKVNPKQQKKMNNNFLRPLQISFNSPKFMLPIRLGMANADGDQDLIVYAFTRKGRIECTNYRNVNIPTGQNIPLFIKDNFNSFYSNLFSKQWTNEGKNIGFLEYAWNVSPQNYLKCDPCVGNPPAPQDLVQAGVFWLNRDNNEYRNIDDEVDYSDEVFFTRMHFRYNRKSFAQDLQFQVTPNNENFQARYIITHPATGKFQCAEGQKYLRDLKQRRKTELKNLTTLTGTNIDTWQQIALSNEEASGRNEMYTTVMSEVKEERAHESASGSGVLILGVIMLGSAGLMKWKGMI